MSKAKKARAKFDKLAALNADQDIGGHIGMAARKAKLMMTDTWVKRNSTDVKGFFDQQKARDMKRGVV